jgi:hypothetical protein
VPEVPEPTVQVAEAPPAAPEEAVAEPIPPPAEAEPEAPDAVPVAPVETVPLEGAPAETPEVETPAAQSPATAETPQEAPVTEAEAPAASGTSSDGETNVTVEVVIAPRETGEDAAPAAPATVVSVARADAAKVYRVWITELITDEEAEAASEWQRLLQAYPDLLGQTAPLLRRVDLGAAGVRYRVLAGPFGDRDTAAALCSAIQGRADDEHCMVVVN